MTVTRNTARAYHLRSRTMSAHLRKNSPSSTCSSGAESESEPAGPIIVGIVFTLKDAFGHENHVPVDHRPRVGGVAGDQPIGVDGEVLRMAVSERPSQADLRAVGQAREA